MIKGNYHDKSYHDNFRWIRSNVTGFTFLQFMDFFNKTETDMNDDEYAKTEEIEDDN